MTRFDYEARDEEEVIRGMLFHQAMENAWKGKNGTRLLIELREALVALPEKRLIAGEVFDERGDCCPMGALLLHRIQRGETGRISCLNVTDENSARDRYTTAGYWGTLEIGEELGLSRALSAMVAFMNDEELPARLTPEERYEAYLSLIERELRRRGR